MVPSAPSLISTLPLTRRSFNHRDRIPLREDVLWRIESGAVRTVTWREEGILVALGYWGVGDVVGQPLCQVKPYEIECLTRVEVSLLPYELWREALNAVISHIQQLEELLSIVHLNPISVRLWQFLVFLGEKFGCDVEQGRLIDLQLTHQELAETINATRVTVTRLLQQFKQEGMLLRHSRRLVLCRH